MSILFNKTSGKNQKLKTIGRYISHTFTSQLESYEYVFTPSTFNLEKILTINLVEFDSADLVSARKPFINYVYDGDNISEIRILGLYTKQVPSGTGIACRVRLYVTGY